MNKKIILTVLLAAAVLAGLSACGTTTTAPTLTSTTTSAVGWDGKSVTYSAADIRRFGSGTPAGTVNYDADADTATIWNIDASLDNYGGIQTPTLTLDFSKAVFFQMEVASCYSQYIVKLAVEGESEYYYVLSDSGETGLVSINVVDAMLSDKYRGRNTQPDPGYASGWKYAGQTVNCTFHILAKGPDGEKQTAELVLKSLSVYNDMTAVTGIDISSSALEGGTLRRLKGSDAEALTASVLPAEGTDQDVVWSSLDESVATVDASGNVSFVGVGSTSVVATSTLDQSKSASVPVVVTSGFEDPLDLRNELGTLAVSGSETDAARFLDLFRTTWGTDIDQPIALGSRQALASRISGNALTLENYFDPGVSALVTEAEAHQASGTAYVPLMLTGTGSATVYRWIGGKLYSETYSGYLKIGYAAKTGSAWEKLPRYQEKGIVVWEDGTVRKYEIDVLSATLLGDYAAADLGNPALWIIPDRTLQSTDSVIHALSPAAVSVSSGLATLVQNKYPEAKYCFGGIVGPLLSADAGKEVQIVLDVAALNRMNDYVRTMWEIKILYYRDGGTSVVSSNPLKVASGNAPGIQVVSFVPAYPDFRIYLVVNGSDIGAQFAAAQMQIRSLKLYYLND